ncbi:hypothetical protein ACA910_022482 [Epithemia clementina (nom. ined.)]
MSSRFSLAMALCRIRQVPKFHQRAVANVFFRDFSAKSSVGRSLDHQNYSKQDVDYCVNLVRDRDREGFYCGLLMPRKVQKAFFILRAFNAELASIKGEHHARSKGATATGTMDLPKQYALQMRLQWWNNAISHIYGEEIERISDPSFANLSISCWESPIVRALSAANQEMKFTRRFLERLIESRQNDVEIMQFSTLEETKNYAEQSVSSLLYLTLECLGVREDAADEAASYAGVGIGLTTALRGTSFRLVHGEVTVPSNLLGKTFPYNQLIGSVVGDSKLSDEDAKEWKNAVTAMALSASSYLAEARDKQGQIPKSARTVLLPVVPASLYLSRLEKYNYDVFEPALHEPQRVQMMMMMARTWLTGIL